MSLLLGFGRGLQQGAGMLSQGMAEDRQVKQQAEIEAMREASMERRWKMQTDREDKRNALLDERFNTETARNQANFEKELGLKQSQLSAAERKEAKEKAAKTFEVIDKQYAATVKALQSFAEEDAMGKKTLPASVQAKLLEAEKQYNEQTLHALEYLGSQGMLDGTEYEARYQTVKSRFGESDISGYLAEQGGLTDHKSYIKDAYGNVIDKPQAAASTRPNIGLDGDVAAGADDPNAPGFGLFSGISAGYNAGIADTGSMYGNLKQQNAKFNPRNTSPVGHVLHPIGGLLGVGGGLLQSAAQDVYQVGSRAFETPSERDARLAKQSQGR